MFGQVLPNKNKITTVLHIIYCASSDRTTVHWNNFLLSTIIVEREMPFISWVRQQYSRYDRTIKEQHRRPGADPAVGRAGLKPPLPLPRQWAPPWAPPNFYRYERDGGGALEVEDELSLFFYEFLDPLLPPASHRQGWQQYPTYPLRLKTN
jgi:hypothetical protein